MNSTYKPIIKDKLHKECDIVKETLRKSYSLRQLQGKSRAILRLREMLKKASVCDVSVLISGESGTGKELAARAIHYLSSRASKPFVPVNCGAIPDNLFENELFGHVQGAFTDARFPQKGLVKEAECGTLFLDEIGTVSPYIQTKFLRLLQEKEFRPLGASSPLKADIRIVAATNQNLRELVDEGRFRVDLLYRLVVFSIHIPPLRERKQDIPILSKHFLKKYCKEYKFENKIITEAAMKKLMAHSWPGNVRELENKIQQLIIMCSSSVIDTEDIKFFEEQPSPKENKLGHFKVARKTVIDKFEKTYLTQVLTMFGGDVVNAAKYAGKSRSAMWNILKKHNISPQQFRS